MTSLKNRSIIGSAALAATIFTIGVTAAPLRAEPVKLAVAYGDLDVRSHNGADELQARIRRAADRVCLDSDAGGRFQGATCRSQAIKGAQAQLAMKNEAAIQFAAR